ncbi:hypothetical protein G1C94_0691 [Bifidobacterium sp. DSM 109963]|uniref:DUF2207 domain-containing protein n=1 Tax=Bifidobacterium panos TaxID=2675321 RepID=A0ABX1SZP5_9BIFI|nr:hypothetical protein [Bifidobacterium sp. DSM 109963]
MSVVFALLAGFITTTLVAGSDEADLSYHSIDYDAVVLPNGDFKVSEHLDYKLQERKDDDDNVKPWKQLYWQYTLDSAKTTNISDITVCNATTGETYEQIEPRNPSSVTSDTWNATYAKHWYIADVTNGVDDPQPFDPQTDGLDSTQSGQRKTVEIGWNIPVTDEADSLKFDITMTFHNAVTQYSDVTSFQWEPIAPENEVPAGKVTGTLHFPEGITTNTSWAWLHTKNTSDTKRTSDGSLNFTVYNLKSNGYIDVVAAYDSSVSSGVKRVADGERLDSLKADEARQEKEWHDSQRMRAIITLIIWIGTAVAGIALCVWGIIAVVRSNKASRYSGNLEYWRDQPGLSPASAVRLIDVVSSSKGTAQSRSMTATVLSLVVKHAIAIYPGPASIYRGIDMSQADAASLSSMIGADPAKMDATSKTSTLVILPAALNSRETLELSQSESSCLDLLIDISQRVGSPVFDFKQMKKACKGWETGHEVIDAYNKSCDNEFSLLGVTESRKWQYLLAGALTAALGIFAVGYNTRLDNLALALCMGLPLLLVGLFCMMAGAPLALTDRGQEYAGRCLGLKRYMHDFSDFSDRGTPDLTLWDWYMVYAAAFGISKRVLKELAKAYPQVSDPEWLDANAAGTLLYWNYRPYGWYSSGLGSGSVSGPMFGGDSFSPSFSDIGSQINSGFASVRSTIQAAAPSSSSGSDGSFFGGGFGGSSGGFGGGVSGGR